MAAARVLLLGDISNGDAEWKDDLRHSLARPSDGSRQGRLAKARARAPPSLAPKEATLSEARRVVAAQRGSAREGSGGGGGGGRVFSARCRARARGA